MVRQIDRHIKIDRRTENRQIDRQTDRHYAYLHTYPQAMYITTALTETAITRKKMTSYAPHSDKKGGKRNPVLRRAEHIRTLRVR